MSAPELLDSASRRVVTVVFADLAGYTRLASTLDVETVHRLVRPLLEDLRQTCLSLGGVVPGLAGDGFMAVFGARRAQEDDVERALRAAARMQAIAFQARAAHHELPGLRIGVNTGEVLVAPSWEPGGFSVVGDPVNVASRLCDLAGEVLVSDDTLSLLSGVALASDVTAYHVKNRDQPVSAAEVRWRDLLRLPEVSRDWRTPFTGRSRERDELDDARGAVLLMGEPGIGKTRLAAEWLAQRPGRHLVARFAALPWTETTPLAALAHDLPEDLVVPPLRRRRLERLAGRAVDADEVDSRQAQLETLVEVLSELSEREPLTVLLDDAHAADAEDRAAIPLLVSRLSAAGSLVVLTSRETLEVGVPTLHLGPLVGAELEDLVRVLLPDANDEMVALVASRTGGNPFFVEQSAQLLRERGGLPPTERLQAIPTLMRLFVASRIDLLDDTDKAVLRVAAVLGEGIDVDVLNHLAPGPGSTVERLVDRGLLRWEPTPHPWRPVVLEFCHQLFRDVAYDEITREDRIAIHRAAAEWYGTVSVVDVLGSEARHLEAVLSLGGGDCSTATRALEVLVFLARSLLEERPVAAREAVERAEAVLQAWAACDLDPLGLLLVRAHVAEQEGDFAAAQRDAATAESLALEADRREDAAVAALVRGRAAVMVDPQSAGQLLDVAAERFAVLGDRSGQARVEVERARARAVEGLGPRVDAYRSAHHVALRAGDRRLASLAAQDLALHVTLHDLPEGAAWVETARDLQRSDDALGRCRVRHAEVLALLLRGELREAAEGSQELFPQAWAAGALQTAMMCLLQEIECRALLGERDGARALLAEGRVIAEGRQTDHLAFDLDLHEALVDLDLVRLEQLRPLAEARQVDFVRQADFFTGCVALGQGRFPQAAEAFSRAQELDRRLGAEGMLVRSAQGWLVATMADGGHIPLSALSAHRTLLRRAGAGRLEEELSLRLLLDEALTGHRVAPPDGDDALPLQVRGLTARDPEVLERAALAWEREGGVVWQAQCLLWVEEMTGARTAGADLLARVAAPPELAGRFRAQVAERTGP